MQVHSSNTLPVITGLRPQTTPRRPVGSARVEAGAASQTSAPGPVASQQAYTRAPVFIQPMTGASLSRNGEEALRTYREVAMSGGNGELVNRLNVIA